MKTIHIQVKDNYAENILDLLKSLENVMIDSIELEDDFNIDKNSCLTTLARIKRGEKSSFSEIKDIDEHIKSLKDEIN